MKTITLKVNLPTGNGNRRMLRGAQIRVSDADYARLVPRYAHDTIAYLAADAERKEAYNKANPDKVKAFKAAVKAREDNAKAVLAERKEAAKVAAAAEEKIVALRLAKILKNEELARKAKKAADAATIKAATASDGNK